MSTPATPLRSTTGASSSTETNTQAIKKRTLVASIEDIGNETFDEDDKTYMVTESESDESLEYECTEIYTENGVDDDNSETLAGLVSGKDLSQRILLVDESCIALAGQSKGGVSKFLLKHEIPRKIFHSFHGIVTVYLYSCGYSQQQIAVPLWGIFLGTFLFEVVRLNSSKVNNSVLPWVKYFIRDSETNSWNGIVFYLAGVSLVLTFAPKDIAVVSIMLLSWADTAASTFGRAFGKYTPRIAPGKSLAGCLASAVIGVLVCYLFYGYLVPSFDVNGPEDLAWTPGSSVIDIHTYAAATGIIASVSEALGVASIDDNFTIPVFSAIFLSGLVWACHI